MINAHAYYMRHRGLTEENAVWATKYHIENGPKHPEKALVGLYAAPIAYKREGMYPVYGYKPYWDWKEHPEDKNLFQVLIHFAGDFMWINVERGSCRSIALSQ